MRLLLLERSGVYSIGHPHQYPSSRNSCEANKTTATHWWETEVSFILQEPIFLKSRWFGNNPLFFFLPLSYLSSKKSIPKVLCVTLSVCCSLLYTGGNGFKRCNNFQISGAHQICSAVNYCEKKAFPCLWNESRATFLRLMPLIAKELKHQRGFDLRNNFPLIATDSINYFFSLVEDLFTYNADFSSHHWGSAVSVSASASPALWDTSEHNDSAGQISCWEQLAFMSSSSSYGRANSVRAIKVL